MIAPIRKSNFPHTVAPFGRLPRVKYACISAVLLILTYAAFLRLFKKTTVCAIDATAVFSYDRSCSYCIYCAAGIHFLITPVTL